MRPYRSPQHGLPVALTLLFWLGSGYAHATPIRSGKPIAATEAGSAEATAQDFYRWYVARFANDRQTEDDSATYSRFLATSLRKKLADERARGEAVEADYFLKAQDHLDSWTGHVATDPATVHGATARTTVTLGTGGETWQLTVTLLHEDGAWKIVNVTQPRARPVESFPARKGRDRRPR